MTDNDIVNIIKKNRFDKTMAYENEMIMLGEIILSNKMLLWDTEKLPFIPSNWDDYGFKVFSQNNEDGLLQYIIHHTELPNRIFVEFGVEDYSECNTKFLLWHNNWKGFVIDGADSFLSKLQKRTLFWKRTISARSAFITKENINDLIESSGYSGNIGLLSVDIDGNDFWILEAIDCVDPQILICEYNSIFGAKEKVSIPYKTNFNRTDEHYSNLYWGASLGAYVYLANQRGYKLVCINNLSNNAFFVKRDASNIPEVSIEDAWRDSVCRESRDKDGNLSFKSMDEGRKLIENMLLVDVVTGISKNVADLVV